MKTMIMALTLLSSLTVMSAENPSMTFDSILLKKNSLDNVGVVYIPNRHIETWCAGLGSPMSIMSYEAAQTLDNLADGFYRCAGKFVQIPTDRTFPIQIFQLDSCTEVNATDLRAASCKVIK